jgi:hypothetical protein
MEIKLIKILELIISALIGSGIIWVIVEVGIWKWIRKKSADKTHPVLKELTLLAYLYGVIEISMFSFSFIVGAPYFIFLWIGVKTALRWDRRKNEEDKIPDKYVQRGSYFSFLIGSALSIIFSYCIASINSSGLLSF